MWNTLCGVDLDQIEKELFNWLECREEERVVISKEKIRTAVENRGELIPNCFEKKHFENFLKQEKEGMKKGKFEILRILFDKIKPNSEFDIFLINKVNLINKSNCILFFCGLFRT